MGSIQAEGQQCPDLVTVTAAYLSGAVPFPPPSRSPLVVSHADMKGEHVLFSGQGDAITGIIDWSDIALCDPGEDFKGLLIWLGELFLRQVLTWYTGLLDPYFLERLLVYGRYQSLSHGGGRFRKRCMPSTRRSPICNS